MPKKIQNCTKEELINVSLPVYGDTYTVISHESVMDMSLTALVTAGFTVIEEQYRSTADGNIAQAMYKLSYNTDPELAMMFAWTNSYNKQVRFKCGIGAHINKTRTVMVCGDMGSWARKHTGTADEETQNTITEQVTDAQRYYDQLVTDKNNMKNVIMNKRRQAQMLGILFAEYQILTTEQASIIRQQMDKPSYTFEDTNSLWAFYNYVTVALQFSHPKTWMEDQRILHYFISNLNTVTPTVVVEEVPILEIEELKVEEPEVIEIEEIASEIVSEDTLQYIDPVDNILEVPVYPELEIEIASEEIQNEEINSFEESEFEEIELSKANLDIIATVIEEKVIVLEEADFDFDFSATEDQDEDDNASFEF